MCPFVSLLRVGPPWCSYFDPDNYISTSALLWSGDPFLQEQVRIVVERSGAFLTEDGQLPHHFNGVEPVYQALSGEIQTGPNVFWILTCLNYAKSSGNFAWLRAYMPTLRLASNFLFDLIDDDVGMANVPGSLMIDVFLRSNFTADTNAMLVGFLQEFSAAERFVQNSTGAEKLEAIADSIAAAMNEKLWCAESGGLCDSSLDAKEKKPPRSTAPAAAGDGDHFFTQWDGPASPGSSRDFMDYDANLIACAHGIPSDLPDGADDGGARARRILARIDGGQCRSSQTFVSERYYGPQDTTGGNVGDSWCAMGRIAWFDALSRRRYGDLEGFNSLVLEPLQRLLLGTTWMHERIECGGIEQLNRTAMYFEYPSTVAMLLRTVKYGVQIGYGNDAALGTPSAEIVVAPFGPTVFSFHVNQVHVDFAPNAVSLDVYRMADSATSQCSVVFKGLLPSTTFSVVTGGQVTFNSSATTTAEGVLTVAVPLGGLDAGRVQVTATAPASS